jgi:putative endonuclease
LRSPGRPPIIDRMERASWLVYILECADSTLYTGITNDLERRLDAHARGAASRYTRARLPVRLAYREEHASRSDALKREAALKRLARDDKLALIARRPAATPAGEV